MDTSKQYIDMCTKSVEIQEKRRFRNGSYFFCIWEEQPQRKKKVDIFSFHKRPLDYNRYAENEEEKVEAIYLPTISELQSFCFRKKQPGYFFAIIMNTFICHRSDTDQIWGGYIYSFNSSEKLWLALVMYNNHGKMWNHNIKDWIGKYI